MRAGNNQWYKGGTTRDEVPLFAMAAHELKSPLALIRQLASSLDDEDISDSERSEIARRIELTSERSLRLTSNLTRAERLELSLFPLEPLNVLAVCDEVVRELTPLYTARGCQMSLSRRSAAPLAIANRDLLTRVLLQFGDNALQYAASDKVELAVSSSRRGNIRIGVRDFGPAVTDLHRATKSNALITPRRPESSGLGLMISRQFANAMNAQIGVIRHRDGASFYIDLAKSHQLSLI